MSFEIRIAQVKDDFYSVAELAHALSVFHDEDDKPDAEKLYRDKDWTTILIASVGKQDIGFLSYFKGYETHTAQRFIEIQNLYVLESHRSQGIGHKLMNAALQQGASLHVDTYKLGVRKTNERAMEFYRRLGFTFRTEGMNLRGKRRAG